MDIYSKLDGTVPVSHISNGVWKIRKKSRTDDERNRDRKRKRKKKDEVDIQGKPQENNTTENEVENDLITDEQVGYGSVKKKKTTRKIDLKI